MELDVGDGIEVQPPKVEELPEADRELTRRRYHFELVNHSLPLGPSRALATIRTRDDAPAVKEPLVIGIDVADPVAIAPNPLVLKYSRGSLPPSRRVSVVNRSGNWATATLRKYDHELLHIKAAGPQTGSLAAFEVAVVEAPESAVESKVVFDLGQNGTRELIVRFEPSDRP